MKCEKCGSEIPEGSAFCNLCGNKIVPPDTPELATMDSNKPEQSELKKKPNILLFAILSIVVLVGVGVGYKIYTDYQKKKAEELYIYNFTSAALTISGQTTICQMFAEELSSTWRKAIDDGKDFNVEIVKYINFLDEKGAIDDINQARDENAEKMKLIQNPIVGYEEPYNLLIEMYGYYTQVCNQVTSPSGSLLTYNQDLNSNSNEFDTTFEKLAIMIPAVKGGTQE